jgi:hypothetical protein
MKYPRGNILYAFLFCFILGLYGGNEIAQLFYINLHLFYTILVIILTGGFIYMEWRDGNEH